MKTQIQKPHRKNLLAKARQAFSLVELLVVIAVIGIIAAIAIPNIAGITANANVAKDQRNGQSIASIAAAAQAAGWVPSGTKATDVASLVAGVTAGTGTNIMSFKVPNLGGTDLTNAKTYVSATLEYVPAGGQ